MNILVLDVGTSSMRGIVFDQNGNELSVEQISYHPCHGANGKVEQSAEYLRDVLLKILKNISLNLEKTQQYIEAIVITAQRSSVIPVDHNGTPLCHAIMWQDTRNRKICEDLETENTKISALSGAVVNTVFSGGKMRWVKQEHPEIFQKTYKMLNIPEYLMHEMTGNYFTDVTYASRSNLMNLRSKVWDKELLELFEIPERMLCDLLEPGSVVGYLENRVAKATGLMSGIPVITAGGDQQCAAFGQGAISSGDLSIVLGTGAFLMVHCDTVPERIPSNMICNCSSVPGKYLLETNVLTCGAAFNWFCNNFYDWNGTVDYNRLNHELEEVYLKEEGCAVLPFFQGRSTPNWNPQARAMIGNLSLEVSRTDLLKALLEGIFLEINNNIDFMRQYSPIKQVYISGGLTKSGIINQMQSDIYGIPLIRNANPETTALGALVIAWKSMGIIQTFKEGYKKVINPDNVTRYKSNSKKKSYYQSKQRLMNELYKKQYGE